ncbi:MAG TPA: efflux transporter outer membrane subunit [Vicinamibacteria bacterium]|nr:efflux transporter outer membrane subunit [Vicinamibacteria bacterium]
MNRGEAVAVAILASVSVSACAIGPHYVRPSAPVPPAFKEEAAPGQRAEDWKPAEPRDAARRGPWWDAFGDPELSALEEQVDRANQDVARAEANYRVARALARGAHADLLPTVTGGAGVTISHNGNRSNGQGTTSSSTSRTTTYQVPIDLSWEADVFGRIRRNLEANVAEAQASAADLESVRLTLHAELATDWFLLKGLDAERRLLSEAVDNYARALELNRNRHDQGIVSGVDVAQAETQLETTRVEATDLEIDRAQLEHAIAVLVGRAPAALTLPPSPIDITPPPIPTMLPAELLERRPDIAAAERRVAAANAQVGVATAAFFPRLLLAASAGLQSASLGSLFSAPSRFWSLGPSLMQTLFSGGRRRAAVDQARASYDGAVAAYRQSALGAFQEVEDGLAAQRILGTEAAQEAAAVAASDRLVAIARNRYNGGITTYLEVVTAETAALNNHRAAVQLLTRRLTNGVALVKALGGGWDAASLPPAGAVLAGESSSR